MRVTDDAFNDAMGEAFTELSMTLKLEQFYNRNYST